jgi:hypothetical protein
MRLPRPRFTVRSLMVAVAIVAVLIFMEGEAVVLRNGRATISLQFTVLDADTNRPASGASIRLDDDGYYGNFVCRAIAGRDGGARVTIRTGCGDSGSIIRRNRNVTYWPWTIYAEVDGHQSFKGRLEKYTADRRFHDYDAIPPPIVIRLRKSPDPPEPK